MAVLASVARLKARGVKIILIYSDNLASLNCARGKLYRDLLSLADHCIVPSSNMAKLARPFLRPNIDTYLIEDPWQVCEQPYKAFTSSEKLRIAWFGNTGNASYVIEHLGSLMKSVTEPSEIELIALTSSQGVGLISRAFKRLSPLARKTWSFQSVVWDDRQYPEQLEDVLGSAHLAWIPSNPNDAVKAGVSHNRIVDAIRSGCIPIASEMHSYLEMKKLALVGSDHSQLINLAIPQYQRLIDKYSQSRNQYLQRFSPERNLQLWCKFLANTLGIH